MTGEEKRQLHKQLWKVADELRGRMDADDFRDYILGFVFLKYLSGKIEAEAARLLSTEGGIAYAELDSRSPEVAAIYAECLDALGYFLAPDRLFGALVDRARDGEFVLDDIKQTLDAIEASATGQDSEEEFIHLFEDMDLDNSKLGKTPKERNALIGRVIAHLDGIDFHLEESPGEGRNEGRNEGRGDVLGDATKSAPPMIRPAAPARCCSKSVGKRRWANSTARS